jgi:hypothetical protein
VDQVLIQPTPRLESACAPDYHRAGIHIDVSARIEPSERLVEEHA